MLQRPRRHCRRCRRASHAPRSPTRLRLRSERLWLCHPVSTRRAQVDRHVHPPLRAARPALAVAPEPARHLRPNVTSSRMPICPFLSPSRPSDKNISPRTPREREKSRRRRSTAAECLPAAPARRRRRSSCAGLPRPSA
eukprot:scaffold22237_cov54-Phaeocystis_antarctica.AAC.1